MKLHIDLVLILLFSPLFCAAVASQDQVQLHSRASFSLIQNEVTVELETEIGKEHFFGNLTDLVVTEKGDVLVQDRQKLTIEQFSPDGEFIGTVTGEGGGPGEIRQSVRMILKDDTLVVQHMSRILSYYARNSDGRFEHHHSINPAQKMPSLTLIGPHHESGFWARKDSHQRDSGEFLQVPLVVADRFQNILRDSVHTLLHPNPWFITGEGGMGLGGYFTGMEKLIILEDGQYLIANSGEGELIFYDRSDQMSAGIELDLEPQLLTAWDREHLFHNMPASWQQTLEDHLPDYKPHFGEVHASENYLWIYLHQTPEEKQFMVLSRQGKELGRFSLPRTEEVMRVRDDRIYTIYRNPEAGDYIRIHNVKLL